MCCLAGHSLWRRTHSLRDKVAYMLIADVTRRPEPQPLPPVSPVQTALACVCIVTSLGWAVLALSVNSAVIAPAKVTMPCDGECSSCEVDRHCRGWSANLTDDNPILAICPPAIHDDGSESDGESPTCLAWPVSESADRPSVGSPAGQFCF